MAAYFRSQVCVEHLGRWQFEIDVVAFHLYRGDTYRVVITTETSPLVERKCLFDQRAGDFGGATGIAENTTGQHKSLLVRAHLLTGIPGAMADEVEHGNLYFAVL